MTMIKSDHSSSPSISWLGGGGIGRGEGETGSYQSGTATKRSITQRLRHKT
jgi:hypothetical protein